VDNSSADSNQLEIVSGFQEFPIAQNANNIIWCKDAVYTATIGGDIVDERRNSDNNQEVITSTAPDGLFDNASWSTHTSAGTDPAFASETFNQAGANNGLQASAPNQPGVSSNGSIAFTSVNHRVSFSSVVYNGDNFTIVNIIKPNEWNITHYWTNSFLGAFRNFYLGTKSGGIVIGSSRAGATVEATVAVDLNDGNDHCEVLSYDSSVGFSYYIDGVQKTVVSNPTGTINTATAPLDIGQGGGLSLLHDRTFAGYFPGVTVTPTEALAISDWSVSRGYTV